MKKVALVAVLVLGLVSVGLAQTAHASETKTIAIIDTAIDSSRFSNVVHEVCFTLRTCPNGQSLRDSAGHYSFSEGKGSALVNDFSIRGADHGFNMVTAATFVNPAVKIVFIRISDEKVYDTFSMIRNDGGSLSRALAWVESNSSRFNISAVSISQSRSNFPVGSCPKDAVFEKSVIGLKSKNISTFVATGNDSKKNQIGFPACVPGVLSVASAIADGTIVANSNVDATTKILSRVCIDFVGTACLKVPNHRGVLTAMSGTSIATAVATSMAVGKNQSQSWDYFITTLPKSGNYSLLLK